MYDVAIGSSQAHITLTVHSRLKRVAAAIYINDNKELYKEVQDNKSEIEVKIGFALDWQELPAKRPVASSSLAPATSSTNNLRRS